MAFKRFLVGKFPAAILAIEASPWREEFADYTLANGVTSVAKYPTSKIRVITGAKVDLTEFTVCHGILHISLGGYKTLLCERMLW
jgi:hypothetical protein